MANLKGAMNNNICRNLYKTEKEWYQYMMEKRSIEDIRNSIWIQKKSNTY